MGRQEGYDDMEGVHHPSKNVFLCRPHGINVVDISNSVKFLQKVFSGFIWTEKMAYLKNRLW